MRELLRPVPLGIYFLSFALGMVGALVMPTFSLFLARELGVRPLLVGLPFTGVALTSIFYNQIIGRWSDRLRDRRPLVTGFCLVGTVACAIFAVSRNYAWIAFSAVGLLSLAMVAYSQMLAYSLDYADRRITPVRVPLFNAIVRAQIAIAWVAGPPAGFVLASYMGFSVMYWAAAGLFAVVGLISIWLLPQLPRKPHATEPEAQAHTSSKKFYSRFRARRSLLLCLVAFSLMWGVNNSYLISLPLHLGNNLSIGSEWVGWIMGTCALLEVPIMLLCGYLAASIRLMAMVRIAGVAALLLYAGVYWATSLWHLFALQLLNAIFIGVLAGLGVSVVQALLPGRSGSASALYTNTTHLGNLLSSLQVAVVAELFNYRSVFAVSLVLVAMAMLAFAGVRLDEPKRQQPMSN